MRAVETFVDVVRFLALAGAGLAGGLAVREARAHRWPTAVLSAALLLCAAPAVAQAARTEDITWQLVCVAAASLMLSFVTVGVRRRPVWFNLPVHPRVVPAPAPFRRRGYTRY